MSHTPGPWTIHWPKFNADILSKRHAKIATVFFDGDDGEAAANAALIAAAPDLLAAAKKLVVAIDGAANGISISIGAFSELIAAIAKAEGTREGKTP